MRNVTLGLFMIFIGCASLLHERGVHAAGTIPTVGGYSNTLHCTGRAPSWCAPAAGDFTTVGIVIQISSETGSGAFVVEKGKSTAELARVGRGVLEGDRMWVENGSVITLSDAATNGIVEVAGPATIEFQKTMKIFSGSVRLKSAGERALRFTSSYIAGEVRGEAALWVSRDVAQVLGLAGDVRTWHPKLANARVGVAPGYFTESTYKMNHLQPRAPELADSERFERFLSRFDFEEQPELPDHVQPGRQPSRLIASAVALSERGTRSIAEITEPKSPETIEILRARMWGKDFEEAPDAPLRAKRRQGK